ncbi:MAG TPA: LytTR family DNA-binding domain-containing protein [Verrucomicrobiae bacterium]|nr:LytTR family DNA-binding domain-containing protein [Verrucomicrobiae bacterium]
MKIRAIIVDDEPLARERIRTLLDEESDIELIGECDNGATAVETITEKQPDLLFLDVQMPELDGFGVLEQIKDRPLPAVIFVTAHDTFALQAFEVHAVDYLLKPFDRERFKKALDRALQTIKRRQTDELSHRLSALLAEVKPEARIDRLAIKSAGRVIFLRLDEIDWIEAADNYVNLHVGNESHLHRETMTAMEERLKGGKFMRISRSTIVNVDRIKELQPLFHGEYSVILRNGTRLTLSRGYREKLDALLGRLS